MKKVFYLAIFILVTILCSGCDSAHKSNNITYDVEENKQPVEYAPAVFMSASVSKEPITSTEVDITSGTFVCFLKINKKFNVFR